jgi:hypothetical protein
MRTSIAFLLLFALTAPPEALAQDQQDWQIAVARLHPGDHLQIRFKTGRAEGTFQAADAQSLTTNSGIFPRSDISSIDRIREGGRRVRHIAIAAAIGAGAGAAVGAAAGGCKQGSFGVCVGRGSAAGIFAAIGLAGGALAGALIPAHSKRELIYSVASSSAFQRDVTVPPKL